MLTKIKMKGGTEAQMEVKQSVFAYVKALIPLEFLLDLKDMAWF